MARNQLSGVGWRGARQAVRATFETTSSQAGRQLPARASHFAATSGQRSSQERLKTLVARHVFEAGKDPEQHLDDYIVASPLDRITPDAPPFFVIHGAKDTIVPVGEAREFTRRLREKSKREVAYAEVSGAQHAFDLFPSIRSAHVVRGVERFLEWAYRTSRTQVPRTLDNLRDHAKQQLPRPRTI